MDYWPGVFVRSKHGTDLATEQSNTEHNGRVGEALALVETYNRAVAPSTALDRVKTEGARRWF
jgi:hypothetical protein